MVVHQTRRTKRGGKYVGEGSYGCGFSPALRCKGQTRRRPGMFTKAMKRKEAVVEYLKYYMLKEVDPEQRYIIYPTTFCSPNMGVIDPVKNPEDNIEKCRILQGEFDKSFLVTSKDAGKSLNHLTYEADDYSGVLLGLEQLLEGLALLHKHHIAHCDIKEENITARKHSDGSFGFRFIDIGMVTKTNRLVTKAAPFDNNYFAWPYEMRYTSPDFDPNDLTPSSLKRFYKEAAKVDEFFLPEDTLYTRERKMYPLYSSHRTIYHRFMNDQVKINDFLLRATDVYSLGRVFSKLYVLLTRQILNFGHIYSILDIKHPGHLTTFATLEKQMPKDAMDWYRDVRKEISEPFFDLIRYMLHPNVFKRYTAKEALKEYRKLLPAITKHFKTQKVIEYMRHWIPTLKIASYFSLVSTTKVSPKLQGSTSLSASPKQTITMAGTTHVVSTNPVTGEVTLERP